MNLHVPQRMTVDEYLTWALDQPGRFELIDGVVRKMSPETVGHAEGKHAAVIALKLAIKRSGLAYFALPDGATVRVDKDTAFEPDALVYAAPRRDSKDIEITNPVIIVEVGSPSTHKYDAGFKLKGYMSVPSVHHILLINVSQKFVLHHRRETATSFNTSSVTENILRLDPPGLAIPVADFFNLD